MKEAKGEHKDAWEAFIEARDIYTRLEDVDQNDVGLVTVRRSIARVEHLIAEQNKALRR